MYRKFIGIFLLPMKRILQFGESLYTMVAKTVCHIAPAEQMRIEPCRRHTAGTQAHPFQCISADSGIHHTDIEQRFFFLRSGNIPREQHLQHFLRPEINGIAAQLGHHLVHRSLFLADLHLAVGIPICFRIAGSRCLFNHLFRFSESLQSLVIRFILIISVIHIPLGINTVTIVHQLELRSDTLIEQLPRTVLRAVKILFNLHVVHKVQIYFLRKVHDGTLYKIGTVQHDVQMSRKTERLGVERDKCQVNTRLSGNGKRIHQIIFVERRPKGG